MNGHDEHENPCTETIELMERLRAAGVPCQLATLADVVATDEPMFFHHADFR